MAEVKIGFSTGCFHTSGLDIDAVLALIKKRTEVIELSFATISEMEQALSQATINTLKKFQEVTIHLPWKEDIKNKGYGNNSETEAVIQRALGFQDIIGDISGFVIHPDLVIDSNYEVFKKKGLKIFIENMDGKKVFGASPKDFEKMHKSGLQTVLDLQHAFEYCQNNIKAFNKLAASMGRIHHLHVSGQILPDRHVPVHKADNRDWIMGKIAMFPQTVIILEGKVSSENPERDLARELEYMFTLIKTGGSIASQTEV